MRTAVRENSIEAYDAIIASGRRNTQHAQIIAALAGKRQGLTRAELKQATGIEISSICGRVKELLDGGTIEELPARPNPSGRAACPLRIIPPQSELFA